MYHPLLQDQIRLQQDELRRRTATAHSTQETIENRPRRPRRRLGWPHPARSILRLAFVDTAMRPMPPTCADC